jgi:hypothetical protein
MFCSAELPIEVWVQDLLDALLLEIHHIRLQHRAAPHKSFDGLGIAHFPVRARVVAIAGDFAHEHGLHRLLVHNLTDDTRSLRELGRKSH